MQKGTKMAKLSKEIIKCAFCGKESEHEVFLSSSSFGGMDLDTRPTQFGRDNFNYEIQECPHCHYCNYRIDEADAVPHNFASDYLSLAHDTGIPALAKRYLLAASLQNDCAEHYKAGEMYLKAAWAFDDVADNENANEARKNAAICLKKHIEMTGDGDAAIMLVDILRRSGQFDESLSWIDEIGDTEDELLNAVLAFEKNACSEGDSSCHTMEEVENG